jgi:hypothetical protein
MSIIKILSRNVEYFKINKTEVNEVINPNIQHTDHFSMNKQF